MLVVHVYEGVTLGEQNSSAFQSAGLMLWWSQSCICTQRTQLYITREQLAVWIRTQAMSEKEVTGITHQD